ncbi:MAG: hypothetical protein RR932_12850 [Acinetobacter sp.]
MSLDTNVKWFKSTNLNMPQLSNTWGCLIDTLNAVLVNGLTLPPILSISVDEETKKILTISFTNNHELDLHQVIKINGAVSSALNGEFKVIAKTALSITVHSEATIENVAGLIECSLPPLGFDKVYNGTQKAAYRSKVTAGNQLCLYVDNTCSAGAIETGAKFGKVAIVESVSEAGELIGIQLPYDPASPTKNFNKIGDFHGWYKWIYAAGHYSYFGVQTFFINTEPVSNNKKFYIVGDATAFLLIVYATTTGEAYIFGFGDIEDVNIMAMNTFLLSHNRYISENSGSGVALPYESTIGSLNIENKPKCALYFDKSGNNSHTSLKAIPCFMSTVNDPGNMVTIMDASGKANILEAHSFSGHYFHFPLYMLTTQNRIVGPIPFLRAIAQTVTTEGQVFTETDGCGYVAIKALDSQGYILSLGER